MKTPAEIERQFFEIMMESQYWSADQMTQFQRSHLTPLLHHARAQVPFYKYRLNALFNTDDSINWDRWRDIPTVRRKDLADHRADMQSVQLGEEHGPTAQFYSTGSTGVPVLTTHNGRASWVSRAQVIRSYLWHGIDWNKNLCEWVGQQPQEAAWPEGQKAGTWGPSWDLQNQRGIFWKIDRSTPMEQLLQYLINKNISYMTMRPKAAQIAALEAKRLGFNIRLNAILTIGTSVGVEDRQAVAEVFGAKICALYSSKEGHKMAFQCPTGPHYHMVPETGIIEILNENDEPCKPGEIGRVVVTPMFSYAQPLIRYEQGDLAEVGEPCACGRKLPVIARIVGRITHMFQFPDGSRISPSIPEKYREMLEATTWQIAQTGELTIEIRYRADAEANDDAKKKVTEAVRDIMHQKVDVVFKRIDEIPLTNGNKFIEYVCELPVET